MTEEVKTDPINFSDLFKEAFKHIYYGVKKYYQKRSTTQEVWYLDIGDYITSDLSNLDGIMDIEWYHNERDVGNYPQEILDEVNSYCQEKSLGGAHAVPTDEPALS